MLQARYGTLANPWLTTGAGLARGSIAPNRLVRWDLRQAMRNCSAAKWKPAIYAARGSDQRASRPFLAHGIIAAMNGSCDLICPPTCISLHHIKFPQFMYRLCTKVAGLERLTVPSQWRNHNVMSILEPNPSISTVGTFRALVQCEREKSSPGLTASTEFRIKAVEFCEMSEEGALLQ